MPDSILYLHKDARFYPNLHKDTVKFLYLTFRVLAEETNDKIGLELPSLS